jgi:predicted O-methyltransferase YrrM
MTSLQSTIRVAAFLVLRPQYYPDLFRRARYRLALRMLPAPMARSKEIAEEWASARAVTVETALQKLGGEYRRLEEVFPEEMANAHARYEQCPVALGGGGSLELIYGICELLSARTVIETGVAYGFSSLAMLLSLSRRDGTLFSVDMPYPGRNSERYVGWVVPERLSKNWRLFRYPDYVGLRKVLRLVEQIDLCHYDSDKSYEGRAWAYRKLWSRIRPGGIFVSDDIGDNTAFRDFALESGQQPIVVKGSGSGGAGDRFVGIIVKPRPAS